MRHLVPPRRLVLLAALGLAAGCAPAMVNPGSDEAAIRALENEWQRAIVARDVNRIVDLHTSDALVTFSNSPAARGSAAIRSAYTGFLGLPGVALTWTPTKIDVVSPTVATDHGPYTMSYDTPNGRVTDRGNYMTVWHKIDGQWKVAVDGAVSQTPFPTATASAPMMMMDLVDTQMMMNAGLAWGPLSVPGFDPGAKIAVLHGNPGAKGDYTIRLEFPDGYRFPVHWHPNGEHVTVLSGTFLLAMGNTADWNAVRAYGPGDFLYLPARHAHFGGARGQTVIQLHGDGPFAINVGAPK